MAAVVRSNAEVVALERLAWMVIPSGQDMRAATMTVNWARGIDGHSFDMRRSVDNPPVSGR
jgi:hypothetical protein